jgi:hypothetical protein
MQTQQSKKTHAGKTFSRREFNGTALIQRPQLYQRDQRR